MGFEARDAILELLDDAIADQKAQVRVVAYDLSEPEVVSRLEKIGPRLKIIIDNDGPHADPASGETQAEKRLAPSAGAANVKQQHMGELQHNKTIVVNGPKTQAVVCGSTNFSWRGFFVQANNAVVLRGKNAIKPFADAFDRYWASNVVDAFGKTPSAQWTDLKLKGIKAKVVFSPHATANALLDAIAADVAGGTTSNVLYSLAFLYQTSGAMQEAIKKVMQDKKLFVYGISDRKVGGLDVQLPEGRIEPMRPAALTQNVPEPFKSEPVGGGGTRTHHKFVVIDIDKPAARVYLGSYNFSSTADKSNGENLVLIRDRRIATSYMIEALRLFDNYHFRVTQADAKKNKQKLHLRRPPRRGRWLGGTRIGRMPGRSGIGNCFRRRGSGSRWSQAKPGVSKTGTLLGTDQCLRGTVREIVGCLLLLDQRFRIMLSHVFSRGLSPMAKSLSTESGLARPDPHVRQSRTRNIFRDSCNPGTLQ